MMHYNNRSCSERSITIRGGVLLIFLICSTIHVCLGQSKEATQEELAKYYPNRLISGIELLAGPSFVYGRGNDLFNSYRVFKAGFAGGIGLITDVSPKFGIRMNFMFETKGYKQSIHAINMGSGYAQPARLIDNVTLKYFTVSVLPKYYIMGGRLSFGLGPYMGYLNSFKYHQENYVNGVLTISYTRKKLPYEVFKKFDYGISALAGFDFNTNNQFKWSLNLQYSLGLFDINQPTVTGLMRNNTYTLLVTHKIKNYE